MGGLDALKKLFQHINYIEGLSFIVVQHLAIGSKSALPDIIGKFTEYECLQPEDDEPIEAGKIYFAPGGLHLIVENKKIKIGNGSRINGARPSVDRLFLSSAIEYREKVIAILLTGLLSDGSEGIQHVREYGGTVVVQDPEDAQYPDMPENAIRKLEPDFVLPLEKIPSVIDILAGQVKVKNEISVRQQDLHKLWASLRENKEDDDSQLPSFTHKESIFAILQFMQERNNMLEQLTEKLLTEGNKSMASMYYSRLLENKAHTQNLQEVSHQYEVLKAG